MEKTSTNSEEKYIIDIKTLHGDDNPHECGYCKQKGSYTCGLSNQQMKSATYQDLMDTGWRRCGTYFYKPSNQKNCCKMFTIRLDVDQYEIKKSHKKVWKKFCRLIYGKEDPLEFLERDEQMDLEKESQTQKIAVNKQEVQKESKGLQLSDIEAEQKQTIVCADEKDLKFILQFLQSSLKQISKEQILQSLKDLIEPFEIKLEKFSYSPDTLAQDIKVFPSKIKQKGDLFCNVVTLIFGQNREAFKKLGIDKFVEGTKNLLLSVFTPNQEYQPEINDQGNLSYFILSKQEDLKKMENSDLKQYKNTLNQISHQKQNKILTQEEQKEVIAKVSIEHGKNKTIETQIKKEGKENQYSLIEKDGDFVTGCEIKKGRLVIQIEKAKCTPENFEMYQKYCEQIHQQKEKDESSYKDFLCLTPLSEEVMKSKIKPDIELKMGCKHMNYYLDGELIAVGVIDVFYSVISSVYFFYDPKFQKLSPGVFGALIEIEFIKEMKKFFPSFQYYYLGFYIDDCKKMNYKGDYQPAELLCSVTFKWHNLDEKMREYLKDKQNYRLSPKEEEVDLDMKPEVNIQQYIKASTKISMHKTPIQFDSMAQMFRNDVLYKIFTPIAQGVKKSLYKTLWFDFS